jgi:multifunctional beta-oxidation protein
MDVSKYSSANIARSSIGRRVPPRASAATKKFLPKINSLLNQDGPPGEWAYTDRDVILYNLALGAKRTDLPLVYENDDSFTALPTIGVIPLHKTPSHFKSEEILPNYNPRMGVHGEQYFEVRKYPIPTSATVVTRIKLLEVVDKGNAALVRRGATTVDKSTGEELFYNESTQFIRNSGNFGGAKTPKDRGAATATNKIPVGRAPDAVVTEKTSEEQAAVYRLMGDRNPLHIDPAFSKVGGFPVPILHGLCTMGISAKHILQTYGPFKSIKVRFSGPVIPGQTLATSMWKEGKNRVVFETKVVETGKVCISAAAAELIGGRKAVL